VIHRRHPILVDAFADLLITLVADGNAVVQPLCDQAADLKAGWKYGRPGFPAGSGVLRRKADDVSKAFITIAVDFARAVKMVVVEAEGRGLDLPAWIPVPPWLDAALEEIDRELMAMAGKRLTSQS
jgi:hypothetical protein